MGWFGFSIFHSKGGLTEKRYLFCYLMPRKSSLSLFLSDFLFFLFGECIILVRQIDY